MKISKAIKILDHHNRWRRGNDNRLKMDDPKQLGIAIDTILEDYNRILIKGCDHNWRTDPDNDYIQICEFCNEKRLNKTK